MLSFIKNSTLRKTIEDSIKYMQVICDETQADNKSKIYKEETHRVIILYIVAVIEAILLYVLKERNNKIFSLIYKNPHEISKKIKHLDYPNNKLITAIRIKKTKKDNEIGMKDLIDFMEKHNLMTATTAKEILTINNIRNTFHFTKSRDGIDIDIKKVEKAFAVLLKIIKGAPKAIIKTSI